MRARWVWALAGLAATATACASILGDFETGGSGDGGADGSGGPDANSGDARAEARAEGGGGADATASDSSTPDGARGDATASDARTDAGSPPDASSPADAATDGPPRDAPACAVGLTQCSTGCAALDASATCGSCAHDCHTGSCASGACGAYVVAQQPTTGTVAKLATDGTRVVWSDTGIVAIRQTAATGGAAISLAAPSTIYGGVSNELALAGRTVAFSYLGGTASPSIGLALADVADSGVFAFPGALAVNGVSLNPAATHVFFVDVTGTQGSLNDCAINGLDAGACVGVVGGGRFVAQTAADNTDLFFDLTGANVMQAGLYLDTINMNMSNIFTTDVAQSLAVDGTWAYWTTTNDGGATYTFHRTLEAAPGTVLQSVNATPHSPAFATDGTNVYYWIGSAVVSRPVAGGGETMLAPATAFTQIAVGGGLLVWTDGATIWGLVL